MTRRSFLPAAAAAAVSSGSGSAADDPAGRAILDIRYFRLRNTAENQRQRLAQFLEKSALPAIKRAGGGTVGVFAASVAMDSPFLMTLMSYPSLAAMEQMWAKIAGDSGYQKAREAFDSQPGLSYERSERMLLRAFASVPGIEVPAQGGGKRSPRVFEVRMYESNNPSTLARKINMFNSGEIAIFRKLGMAPVFFGEMLVGPKMPNLVYMLGYDDLAAREKAWRAFGSDPDWKKMRDTPGWADAEIVSNISNFLVSPLPFSDIR
jgi:hypothetical protein